MDDRQREMILRYQPYIFRDRKDPFPIRFVGCTIFTEKVRSDAQTQRILGSKVLRQVPAFAYGSL